VGGALRDGDGDTAGAQATTRATATRRPPACLALDGRVARATMGVMTDEELPPTEAARARRRDKDMEAERRALLRPGMAKVFRQVTEAAAAPTKKPGKRKRIPGQ
jgi:hypothetical protein